MLTRNILTSRLFDGAELALLRRVLHCLRKDTYAFRIVKSNLERLSRLSKIVQSFPSLYEESTFGGKLRGPETLVERLTAANRFSLPLQMPVKARLGKDFVLSKIQTLRSAHLAMKGLKGADIVELMAELNSEIAQSVYTLLAEETLTNIAVDATVGADVQRRAGEWLVRFWDDTTSVEIDDFCPLLESAWQARNRLVLDFGTLMGSVETLRLLGSASNPEFVEALCDESSSDEEKQAFDEFIFGLPYEQLRILREEMQRQHRDVVGKAWVARTLNIPESDLLSGILEPDAMYASYRKRYMAALYRRVLESPGPRRTAEAFLMLHLLRR